MEQEQRPNPDEILKQIQQEEIEKEQGSSRGRFKIFLGYIAGVGKTYRMLQEANSLKSQGVDVVIGVAETHGRTETVALLQGLEIIPKKKIEYKGILLEEMDLDAILERHPKFVLVDELAHTNVSGSRHAKRYQDVEELLYAGIDVYTTLNIQHVESIIDIVHQISYVKVEETVPDRILELADEIELVDLPPEKLLERLKEGKIYIPQKAEHAMQKFFRRGNLLALRELSLKYTAKQVDDEMRSYMERYSIKGPWPVGSRLLVGFSASPTSERLLRIAHRMAVDLDAEWYAVYVESPQQVEISKTASNKLAKNINLAEELGAKVVALSGNVIADEIIDFARQKNINLIVAGLSHRSRLEEFFKGSVLNDLVKKSGSINVLIVGNEGYKKPSFPIHPISKTFDYKPYIFSFLSVAILVTIGWFVKQWLEPFNIGMLLLLPVIASSILWGTRVGIYTALIAVGSFDFFLIPPYLTFVVGDIKYLPSFLVFILISVIVSFLSKGIRWQTESTRNRERFLAALYAFSREIMAAKNADDILERSSKNISEAFDSNVVILRSDVAGHLLEVARQGELELDEKEKAVATWVYRNAQPAGKNTNTLSSAIWHYLPLKTEDKIIGVLGISPIKTERFLSPEQQRLLESFANIIALFLQNFINSKE
jgi:two-component system, OmpR family, sensor histidine kinase KdpD